MVNASATPAEEDEEEFLVTHSLLLPPINSHERKLLYQEIGHLYPMLSLKECNEDNEVGNMRIVASRNSGRAKYCARVYSSRRNHRKWLPVRTPRFNTMQVFG